MYSSGTIGFEPTFELNSFQEPRLRSEMENLKDVLLFVLFSKPGSYPSLPQIGMDIEHYLYEFYDEISETKLKAQITEQCALLGSYINAGAIIIKKIIYKKQPSLLIHIEGKEQYPLSYHNDMENETRAYNIGITYNEMKEMLVNINGI